MFIKLTNGIPETYTIGQLRRDNPQTSFPKDIPADTLAAYGVYPVKRVPAPSHNALTQLIRVVDPVQIGGDWVQQWEVADLPEDMAGENVRTQRNTLLAASDWMALSDVTMSPEWAAYRQALRDVPNQVGFPDNVTWPVKPE